MKEAATAMGVSDILDFHFDVPVDGGIADLFAEKSGKRLFVVEAKFKKKAGRVERDIEPRDPEVVDQAVRYAVYGGFPFYLTCNTKRIILYQMQTGKSPFESEIGAFEYQLTPTWAEEILKLTLGRVPIRFKAIDDTLVDTLHEAFNDLQPEFMSSLLEVLHNKKFNERYTDWLEAQGLPFDDETNRLIAEQSGYLQLNKLLFYQVIRTIYPDRLDPLKVNEEEDVVDALERFYREARKIDYAPIYESDIISEIPLSKRAKERIRTLIDTLAGFDFAKMKSDFIGRVYEKLIPPEERKRLGQFYTPPSIVDFIIPLTVSQPHTTILDPGCGSGSFLVKAYHKLAELNGFPEDKSGFISEHDHKELLSEVYGIDINQFPAHLSVINLALQNPRAHINHVNVIVKDFFDFRAGQATLSGFESITTEGKPTTIKIPGSFNAIIANPPYIRQELLGEKEKHKIKELVETEFAEKVFVGSQREKPIRKIRKSKALNTAKKGIILNKQSDIYIYFFIHGLALLRNNGRLGFISSNKWLEVEYGEPFQHFLLDYSKIQYIVEFDKAVFPDAEVNTAVTILEKESDPQKRNSNFVKFVFIKKRTSPEAVIQKIRKTSESFEDDYIKINVVPQNELIPGKWNSYLRAPQIFFELIKNPKLKPFGQTAGISRGYTTGYDPYFVLDKDAVKTWKIERKYLEPCAPAGKSLKGLIVKPQDINQYFLVVREPKSELKGTYVLKYIEHGEKIDAEPSKRRKKAVPLREVETIKGRTLWYELPKAPAPSIIFPMWFRYQYRPLVNEANIHAQAFYIYINVDESIKYVLAALLYTTLTQFFIELNGRQYSGMLHTKVYELQRMLMLDPTILSKTDQKRLIALFFELNQIKIAQKDAKENKEEYTKLKNKEKKIISEMDDVVYDFLGVPNKYRLIIKEALASLREMRRQSTRGMKVSEEIE